MRALAESATDKRFLQWLKKNSTFTISLVACVVDESHTVETWTGIADQLRIVVRSNRCYPNVLLRWNISFLADGLYIFRQAFDTQLPYVTFRFARQTLQTLLQLSCLLSRPLLAFSKLRRSSWSNYSIFSRKNKNKKYENPLAHTDLTTKEAAWFWLDNCDSQTFHSWVGFA